MVTGLIVGQSYFSDYLYLHLLNHPIFLKHNFKHMPYIYLCSPFVNAFGIPFHQLTNSMASLVLISSFTTFNMFKALIYVFCWVTEFLVVGLLWFLSLLKQLNVLTRVFILVIGASKVFGLHMVQLTFCLLIGVAGVLDGIIKVMLLESLIGWIRWRIFVLRFKDSHLFFTIFQFNLMSPDFVFQIEQEQLLVYYQTYAMEHIAD